MIPKNIGVSFSDIKGNLSIKVCKMEDGILFEFETSSVLLSSEEAARLVYVSSQMLGIENLLDKKKISSDSE